MERKWWHKSVVYQIYPRSFYDSNNDGIGDLRGIISKLDYLSYLGIDVIWISPFFESPMVDNGYDISDYRNVAKEFGSIDDVKELILEAKNRGIKVILDLVLNHTSDQHRWFRESKKGKTNPYRDYYIWRDNPNELKSTFSGSAWEYDGASNQYYLHLFAKEQPDLNWSNPEVRNKLYDMMNWWIDLGVSGFRLDVIEFVGKEIDRLVTSNGEKLHDYIIEMNQNTFGKHDMLTVGETWGASLDDAKLYSDPERQELSMVFQFEHITTFWGDEFGKWNPKEFDLMKLKSVFSKWQNGTDVSFWNSLFWNNHDLPRVVSKYGSKEYRVKSAKMLATILHFMKGTPYIYQGEELGMTNIELDDISEYKDVETLNAYKELIENGFDKEKIMASIYENGRDNARTPFQWDDSLNAGFSEVDPWLVVNPNYKEINVESQIDDDSSVLNYYRKLIQYRKNSKFSDCIIYGRFDLLYPDDPNLFAYTRSNDHYKLLILCNYSDKVNRLETLSEYVSGEILLSNYDCEVHDLRILRPYEAIVIKIDN